MSDQVRYARSLAGKRGSATSEFPPVRHASEAFPSFPVDELVDFGSLEALPGMQPQNLNDMFAMGLFPPLRLGPARLPLRADRHANAQEVPKRTPVRKPPACSKAASTPPRIAHIATPPHHPTPAFAAPLLSKPGLGGGFSRASIIEDDCSEDDSTETPRGSKQSPMETPPDASSRAPSRKRSSEPLASAPHGARGGSAAGAQKRVRTAPSAVDRPQGRHVAGGRGPCPLQSTTSL